MKNKNFKRQLVGQIIPITLAVIFIVFITNFQLVRKGTSPLGAGKASAAAYVATMLNECAPNGKHETHNGSHMACLEKISADALSKFELKDVMIAAEKSSVSSWIANDCHDLAHSIGKMGYKKYQNFPQAVMQCTAYCFYGCFHSVAEEYFVNKYKNVDGAVKSLKKLLPGDDITNACEQASHTEMEQGLCYSNLFHGLGHAYMAISANDVPGSLKLCDESFKGEDTTANVSCYFGVFMINSRKPLTADILDPCDKINKKYQKACYDDKAGSVFTRDVAKNISICKMFPLEFIENCFSKISKKDSTTSRDINLLTKDCDLLPAKYRNGCVKDTMLDLASRFPNDYKFLMDYCSAVGVDNRKFCYDQIYLQMKWLHNDANVQTACGYIQDDKDYAAWCKNY
ncbi:MAG TPA: hypothetical protein VGQ87_03590 [Patescibacteria group bacterium]|nr:hypothetical protein [Patescibacteria group bacterium]